MNKIIFLCSGNYYRSRIAEEYFNHCAMKNEINWIAESKALRKDLHETGNVGPLSIHARQLLRDNGVQIQNGQRMPETVNPITLTQYSMTISMSMIEHKPMIIDLWPNVFERMDYWEVGDIGVDKPKLAFTKIRKGVDELIGKLKDIQ